MKLTKRLVLLLSVALASSAFAQYTFNDASHITVQSNATIQQAPVPGDAYFISPGIGSLAPVQFFLSGANADSIINDGTEVVGATLGTGADIESYDSLAALGGDMFTLTVGITSTDDLSPTGFVGTDAAMTPLDVAAIFMGGNAGGDPIDFPAPAIVSAASIELFDLAGASAALIDITGAGSFTAGVGGGWDGSLGLQFGAGSAGDIGGYELQVTYTIPEPSSAVLGLVAMAGLGLIRRRR